ncbi:MAG: molybdopterin synthase sulfur carrier subunit [Hyphomicrobiaceae bacterium]|jgi:sulfur-carrier protein
MTTNLIYFAWVRERIGRSHETRDIPDDILTAGDLITWLASQGEEYANAFSNPDAVRVAVDQTHADHGQAIAGAKEIAFFPPVTGG